MSTTRLASIGIGLALVSTLTVWGFEKMTRDVAPEPVRLGISVHQITGLVAIAQEQQYFESEKLIPSIQLYKSGILALEDLKNGKQDVITVAETPVAFAGFDRSDLRIIATIGSTDTEIKIVARKDSGISSPADLAGKIIATNKKGTSQHFFLHLFLLKHGIADSDVTSIFSDPTDLERKLVEGEVDAAVLSAPSDTQALLNLGANGIVFEAPGLYERSYNLVTTDAYVMAHPEVIERILKALIKAQSYSQNDPERAMQIIASVFSIDEQDVRAVWPNVELKVSLDQSLLTALDDEARWALQTEQVAGDSIPNFFNMLSLDAMDSVAPREISVIR